MQKEDNEARLSAADTDGDQSSDEFEFTFVTRDLPDSFLANKASEVGQIYPLFDRSLLDDASVAASEKDVTINLQRLMLEDPRVCPRSDSASSSSSIDELDGVAAGRCCARTLPPVAPSIERCKKSSSTGSLSSRQWRLRDLMVGRSHSDGKEKFVFLEQEKMMRSTKPAAVENSIKVKEKRKKKEKEKVTEISLASLHSRYYAKTAATAGGGSSAGGRQLFLPYKHNLIGILGLGRTHHFKTNS